MNSFHEARVLEVRHWTDWLFSFMTTRADGLRFPS
jgi:ferredoxin-NADP reductase